ncbi:MAG: hypothetical protein H7Z21_11565 [Hymenobacter sp.]|nr:hypothetical protein [Hymenobacter sp.]
MTLFENEAGRLSENAAACYLRLDWQDAHPSDESTRQLLEQLLLALRQRQWHNVLYHQQRRGTLSIAVSAWVALDWLPRAVQAGYHRGAIILSRDMQTRLDTTVIGRQYSSRSTLPVYRFFEHEAEALAWLLAAPAPTPAPERIEYPLLGIPPAE